MYKPMGTTLSIFYKRNWTSRICLRVNIRFFLKSYALTLAFITNSARSETAACYLLPNCFVPLWHIRPAVVAGLVCLDDPKSYAGGRFVCLLVGLPMPDRSKERGQTKSNLGRWSSLALVGNPSRRRTTLISNPGRWKS